MTRSGRFPWEPSVGGADYAPFRRADWAGLDRAAAEAMGTSGIAVPSLRVGLAWVLEHLGLERHRDHVLVPRFMGRCVLSALTRHALPTEIPTPATKVAVVVHQLGFRQDLDAVSRACERRGIRYVEDNPAGPERKEAIGPGSMGKFIGLSKVLPIVMGAFFVGGDAGLRSHLRARRQEHSAWSWVVAAGMGWARRRRRVSAHSVLADLMYELYLPARGGNGWLRGNFLRGLQLLPAFEKAAADRLVHAREHLGEKIAVPPFLRIPYVAPLTGFVDDDHAASELARGGMDSTPYHWDAAGNQTEPRYIRAPVLPLNPRIPRATFDSVLNRLSRL